MEPLTFTEQTWPTCRASRTQTGMCVCVCVGGVYNASKNVKLSHSVQGHIKKNPRSSPLKWLSASCFLGFFSCQSWVRERLERIKVVRKYVMIWFSFYSRALYVCLCEKETEWGWGDMAPTGEDNHKNSHKSQWAHSIYKTAFLIPRGIQARALLFMVTKSLLLLVTLCSVWIAPDFNSEILLILARQPPIG